MRNQTVLLIHLRLWTRAETSCFYVNIREHLKRYTVCKFSKESFSGCILRMLSSLRHPGDFWILDIFDWGRTYWQFSVYVRGDTKPNNRFSHAHGCCIHCCFHKGTFLKSFVEVANRVLSTGSNKTQSDDHTRYNSMRNLACSKWCRKDNEVDEHKH